MSSRTSARVDPGSVFEQVGAPFPAQLGDDSLSGLVEGIMSGRYLTAERLEALRDALTDRNWQILSSLQTVKVATAHQLERLHFRDGSPDPMVTARQRRRVLEHLDDLQVLTRLDRRIGGVRAGSSGFVYGVGIAGQRLLNAFGDHARRARAPWTPGISFLAHRLAITELFVRLVEAERIGSLQLADFVAEPDCWRGFAGRGGARLLLKPDAYVRLLLGAYEYVWFVEVDRGSESRLTIQAKCQRYVDYWLSGREEVYSNVFPAIAWLVPDIRRADVIVGVIERLPADSRALFQVGIFDQAIRLLAGGDHAAA